MTPALRTLLSLACFVILAAALHQARDIVVPFLLAVFIATACAPPMAWLRNYGMPQGLALLLVGLGILAVGGLIGIIVGGSMQEFQQALPTYYTQLRTASAGVVQELSARGWVAADSLLPDLDPSFFLTFVSAILAGFGAVLTNAFLILFAVLFLLADGPQMAQRIQHLVRRRLGSDFSIAEFGTSVYHYLAIKTLTSALTGIVIALWLMFLGIPHAVLWGLVAFLLNYIPNIGSVLAAIPAVLLAALTAGVGTAGLAALGYLAANVALGAVLENQLLGRRLNLSVLVVFLSLVFWGWLLGPVGMLLSIPLTVVVKLALEANPTTRELAGVFGSGRGTPD